MTHEFADVPELITEIKRLDNIAFGPSDQNPDRLGARKQLSSLLLYWRHEIVEALEAWSFIDDPTEPPVERPRGEQ